MANRWRNNGNSERLYFVAPKSLQMVIAAMKLKKQKQKQKQKTLLLERKAMTNLDSIMKSRDNPSLTNVHLVKAMVFPVVVFGC